MPNYTLNSYQVALFPNDLLTSNIQNFVSPLTGIAEFDGNPLVLPLPSNAPKEIPQITLHSSDDTRQCQISYEKVYFTFSAAKGGSLEVTIDQIKDLITKVLDVLPKGMTFRRFGFITEYVVDNPGDEILPKIIEPKISPKDITDFSISLTKAAVLPSYEKCNRILSVQKGRRLDDPSKVVTLLQQDFNTAQENQEKFDKAKIQTLLEQAMVEALLEKLKIALCLP